MQLQHRLLEIGHSQRRAVLRPRQRGRVGARQQRAVRVAAVLVRVAEQELAEADTVAVGEPGLVARGTSPLPVDRGLRDAVDEAEGLALGELRGVELDERLEGALTAVERRLHERVDELGARIQQQQRVRDAIGRAPRPMRRIAGADGAEPSRARLGAAHADDVLGREAGDDRVADAERAEAIARQRDLQRGVGQRLARDRGRDLDAREPCACRVDVVHAQQHEARGGELAVAEAHERLDVLELDRRRCAQSSFSHARACRSFIDGASMPARMRWLRSRSCSVSPG